MRLTRALIRVNGFRPIRVTTSRLQKAGCDEFEETRCDWFEFDKPRCDELQKTHYNAVAVPACAEEEKFKLNLPKVWYLIVKLRLQTTSSVVCLRKSPIRKPLIYIVIPESSRFWSPPSGGGSASSNQIPRELSPSEITARELAETPNRMSRELIGAPILMRRPFRPDPTSLHEPSRFL